MHTNSNLRGDNMKMIKDLSLMAMGAALVILYQKYNDDMMVMAENLIDKYKCKCGELEY